MRKIWLVALVALLCITLCPSAAQADEDMQKAMQFALYLCGAVGVNGPAAGCTDDLQILVDAQRRIEIACAFVPPAVADAVDWPFGDFLPAPFCTRIRVCAYGTYRIWIGNLPV